MEAFRHWARVEGIFAAPEGAASLVAYRKLRARGFFSAEDKVVLFNTGSGLKYLDVIERQKEREAASLAPNRRHYRALLSSAGDFAEASRLDDQGSSRNGRRRPTLFAASRDPARVTRKRPYTPLRSQRRATFPTADLA